MFNQFNGMNAMRPQMGPSQFGQPMNQQMQSPQLNQMQTGMMQSPGMTGQPQMGANPLAMGQQIGGMGMGMMQNKDQGQAMQRQQMAQQMMGRMMQQAMQNRMMGQYGR